jgi:DNA invertase Pin-like site-specific DNA recombinase
MIAHFEKIGKNTIYGYARISSKEQADNSSLESQKEELLREGVPETNIYPEVESATNSIDKRLVFSKLIHETLKVRDSLFVSKLDRCSRNTLSFLQLKNLLSEKGVIFEF